MSIFDIFDNKRISDEWKKTASNLDTCFKAKAKDMEEEDKRMIINTAGKGYYLDIPARSESKDWRIGRTWDGDPYYYIDIKDRVASYPDVFWKIQEDGAMHRICSDRNHTFGENVKRFNQSKCINSIESHDGFFRINYKPYKKPIYSTSILIYVDKWVERIPTTVLPFTIHDNSGLCWNDSTVSTINPNTEIPKSDCKGLNDYMNS